jgi:hypothetical protein
MDLIGHCFLTIDLLDEEANAVEAQAETPTIIATLVVDE